MVFEGCSGRRGAVLVQCASRWCSKTPRRHPRGRGEGRNPRGRQKIIRAEDDPTRIFGARQKRRGCCRAGRLVKGAAPTSRPTKEPPWVGRPLQRYGVRLALRSLPILGGRSHNGEGRNGARAASRYFSRPRQMRPRSAPEGTQHPARHVCGHFVAGGHCSADSLDCSHFAATRPESRLAWARHLSCCPLPSGDVLFNTIDTHLAVTPNASAHSSSVAPLS